MAGIDRGQGLSNAYLRKRFSKFEVTENLTGNGFDVADLESLDEVEKFIRESFPDSFVYRGSRHVALHRRSNDSRRMLCVVERG